MHFLYEDKDVDTMKKIKINYDLVKAILITLSVVIMLYIDEDICFDSFNKFLMGCGRKIDDWSPETEYLYRTSLLSCLEYKTNFPIQFPEKEKAMCNDTFKKWGVSLNV